MDKITINSLFVRLEKICCKLQDIFLTLSNQNTPNKNDWEVVCLSNDGGITVIKGIVEFDTSTVPATKTIYLFDGSVATGYTVVSCNAKTFDTEFREVCVDGQKWLQVLVFDKSVSMVAPVQVGWMDNTSAVVPAPDPTLINNINCNECISTPQGTLITWG